MLQFVINTLSDEGYEISLAYYEPFSVNPVLSVPVFQLPLLKKPDTNLSESYFSRASHGIGCWLPELEFTHYWATELWRKLIASHDIHITVSGSCLAALPFLQTETPFLAWIASDWMGDREHRVREFPWFRRVLDRCLVTPVLNRLEKKIIVSGNVIALSLQTQARLNELVSEKAVSQVLGMPIEVDLFKPADVSQQNRKIGFVGRFNDPRKNLDLLFESMAELLKQEPETELVLIGDKLSEDKRQYAKELGILSQIIVHEYIQRDSLPEYLQQLQVFVLPSYQEGLCIAALEAMSCGVPVVSTYCGGPESFIVSGANGLLCASNATSMSAAIYQLLSDQPLRLRYASAARETVLNDFNPHSQSSALLALFDQKFK